MKKTKKDFLVSFTERHAVGQKESGSMNQRESRSISQRQSRSSYKYR
jgi:hypothetical protein